MAFRSERTRIRAGIGTVAGAIVLLLCGVARPAPAQPIDGLTTTNGALRAKATPDECFLGVGINFPFTKPPCRFGTPKVNQAYVWAMTKAPGTIWFGTTANPQCLTQGGLASDPTQLRPYRTISAACEFGSSPYVPWLLPAAIGDFRPPRRYCPPLAVIIPWCARKSRNIDAVSCGTRRRRILTA